MLPMGTVMAACLLIGAIGMSVVFRLPRPAVIGLGLLLEAAGIWNAFWYGLQHFSELWGQMALWSGLVMLASGAFCLRMAKPEFVAKFRKLVWPAVVLMAGFGGVYAWTIYNL